MTGESRIVKLGIVGLGRVGATAPPVSSPRGDVTVIRNHLDAALAVDGIAIGALIEPDRGQLDLVREANPTIAHVPGHASMSELEEGALDIIVLCTPTATRAADVARALALRPRLLLVEKPLAADCAAAEALLRMADAAGVPLRINFNRRFDGPIQRHFQAAANEPPSVLICRYNKGLLNYASHMVDLLQFWFGGIVGVQAIGAAEAGADPTVSFRCDMAAGFPVYVIGLPEVGYDQFEIDIHLPHGRVSFANNGVEKRDFAAVPDLYYPGYAHLRERQTPRDDTPTGGFVEYYRAVVAAMGRDAPLPGCTGLEALANLRVLEAVQASLAAGGSAIALQPDI